LHGVFIPEPTLVSRDQPTTLAQFKGQELTFNPGVGAGEFHTVGLRQASGNPYPDGPFAVAGKGR